MQECTSLPPDVVLSKEHVLRTKLLHKFMPAIDVEMSVEFGGTEDQRLLMLNIRCLTDAMSLMVVDHKTRIVYATSELAQTLGYPIKTLTELSLANIIPPPYAQLHPGFMKVGAVTSTLAVFQHLWCPTACLKGHVRYIWRKPLLRSQDCKQSPVLLLHESVCGARILEGLTSNLAYFCRTCPTSLAPLVAAMVQWSSSCMPALRRCL